MQVLARARALAATPVLADVPAPALVALAVRTTARTIGRGQTVSTRRDSSDHVLVVATGELESHGVRHRPGAIVGALVAFAAPAVTATAIDEAVVLEVTVDDFLDVLAEHAVATSALARTLVAGIRQGER